MREVLTAECGQRRLRRNLHNKTLPKKPIRSMMSSLSVVVRVDYRQEYIYNAIHKTIWSFKLMVQLLILLRQGILSTLLDVDNAVYMTSRIKNLTFKKQRYAIIWGLLIEFIGRIALISFLGSFLSENKVLFTLVGVKFTPDSISLFIAGAFLLYKSSGDLYEFLTKQEQPQQLQPLEASFLQIMGEMAVVNLILSIDAIIVVSARASDFPSIIVIFAISAIIRLCSLEKLAQFIQKYSSINIFISIFMILVGLELFLQGFWFEFPEEIFNTVIVLAIVLTVIDRRRRSQLNH